MMDKSRVKKIKPVKRLKIPRQCGDSAWKNIMDAYFKDFMDFCLPQVSLLIDWKAPWIFLDKELQAVCKDNLTGTRLVDKVIKVSLKEDIKHKALIHFEIQGFPHKKFPERNFIYGYRLFDKHNCPILICAILTDNNKHWRPDHYEVCFGGTTLRINYLVIKLLDYQTKTSELEVSSNPFASVILIQLAALATKKQSDKERFETKLTLTKQLYEKKFSKEHIKRLYLFIDWMFHLPILFEKKFLNKIYQLEVEKKMPYISNAERFGIEKGRKQGRQQGRQQGLQEGEAILLLHQLERKFGPIPQYQDRVKQADSSTLFLWADRILNVNSIEAVFADSL